MISGTGIDPEGHYYFEKVTLLANGSYHLVIVDEDWDIVVIGRLDEMGAFAVAANEADYTQMVIYATLTQSPKGEIEVSGGQGDSRYINPERIVYVSNQVAIDSAQWVVFDSENNTLRSGNGAEVRNVANSGDEILPSGKYTIQFIVTDVFGNSAEQKCEFYIDADMAA